MEGKNCKAPIEKQAGPVRSGEEKVSCPTGNRTLNRPAHILQTEDKGVKKQEETMLLFRKLRIGS